MNEAYLGQVALVVRALPVVAEESDFAIKGGTAINLFELDLPRLSVDIDLTYLKIAPRDESVAAINESLARIAGRLRALHLDVSIRGPEASRKVICSSNGATIKIEPNYILRGTVFPVRTMTTCPRIGEITKSEASMNVLSFAELYGGKVCAALDRQHPRDLFDMAQFYKTHTIDEIKPGLIALALGHNRPLHELLNPILQDNRDVFDQQFAGMTDEPFSYEEHVETWKRLKADVLSALSDSDRRNMLDFVSLAGSPDQFGILNLDKLPAIVWKRRNLESLKAKDSAKFAVQHDRLQELFQL